MITMASPLRYMYVLSKHSRQLSRTTTLCSWEILPFSPQPPLTGLTSTKNCIRVNQSRPSIHSSQNTCTQISKSTGSVIYYGISLFICHLRELRQPVRRRWWQRRAQLTLETDAGRDNLYATRCFIAHHDSAKSKYNLDISPLFSLYGPLRCRYVASTVSPGRNKTLS